MVNILHIFHPSKMIFQVDEIPSIFQLDPGLLTRRLSRYKTFHSSHSLNHRHRWGNQLRSCLADVFEQQNFQKLSPKNVGITNFEPSTRYPKTPANLQHISSSIYPNTRTPCITPPRVPAWESWLLLSLHSRRNASSSAAAAPWRAAPLRRPRRPRWRRQRCWARWFQASPEDLRCWGGEPTLSIHGRLRGLLHSMVKDRIERHLSTFN